MRRLLAVTAHPDDECFLFGGVLALQARRGGGAALLCLTDGQAGRTGGLCPPEELAAVRRGELERAVGVLGIPELFTPGLADGALAEVGDEEGTRLVKEHVERFRADVLLTFGPEGASGHADHKACFRWTVAAAGGRRLYVSSWPEGVELPRRNEERPLPPTAVVDVSELGDLKRRAFLEHATQQDHLATFDEIQAAFHGREYYHRLHPPRRAREPRETSLA